MTHVSILYVQKRKYSYMLLERNSFYPQVKLQVHFLFVSANAALVFEVKLEKIERHGDL